MKKIKSYDKFLEVSGTEVPERTKGSYFGAAYGDTVSPNTIDSHDTALRYSRLLGRPISEDEFNELYDKYLTMSDKSIKKEFTTDCIDRIVAKIG